MVNYTCVKCLKDFNKMDSYNKHINRKTSCIPNEDYLGKEQQELKTKLKTQEAQIKELQEQMAQLLSKKTLCEREQSE